jgi:large subunit ribosomal protein L24
MHVRKGDNVLVIAGNDKGKTGEIKRVLRGAGRVVVEGINLRWKHKRATQKSPKGERIQEACSIHASNVMLADGSGKRTRKRKD